MTRLLSHLRQSLSLWRSALEHTPPRLIEGISALHAFVWATILVLPEQTFTTGRGYAVLSYISHGYEWPWSLVFGALFVGHLLAYGRGRIPTTACAWIVWLFVSITTLLANPISVGWGIYLILALTQLWACMHLIKRREN